MDKVDVVIDFELSLPKDEESTCDILSSNCVSVNQKCILEYSKNGNFKDEIKKSCKVLRFTKNWKLEEILEELVKFQPTTFSNLLVIIIDVEEVINENPPSPVKHGKIDEDKVHLMKRLLDELMKFFINRPFILQYTARNNKTTKLYHKDENSNDFLCYDHHQEHSTKIINFQSFIWALLSKKIENFENTMVDILPNVNNLRLIWEFLSIFELCEEFFNKIIIKCASMGTKNQLLTILKASFENETMTPKVISSITKTFKLDSSEKSILLAAVENSNAELMKYLADECSHLMKLLPFSHQIKISTAAFNAKHEDFLCDLIEICDFPFPEDFDEDLIDNERMEGIVKSRKQFHKSIKNGNIKEIDATVDKFLGNKIICNTENISALYQAVKLKNFNTYHYLKTKYGFEVASEEEDVKNFIKNFSQKLITTDANIESSISSDDKSVAILVAKSSVYLSRTNKHKYKECHEKIKKWYQQIHEMKFGKSLLKVVSSCDRLKIVFDFENEYTNKIDHMESDEGTIGIAFSDFKWVLIGAEDSDVDKMERRIRRTIAHECCHYAVHLVFKNFIKPYFNIKNNEKAKFYHEIIRQVHRLLNEPKDQIRMLDEECINIVRFALECYGEITEDSIPLGIEQELIVRVVEMLAHYHGNEEKIKELEEAFRPLIDFYANHVNPEFENFTFEKQRLVSEFNEKTGILRELKRSMYVQGTGFIELSSSKVQSTLASSKTTIITTNIKELLLFDIYNNTCPKGPDLFDTENIFVRAEQLKKINPNDNNDIVTCLENVLVKTEMLNVFIDCTKATEINPNWHNFNKIANYVYIVDEEENCKNLKTVNRLKNATKVEINYEWKDLSEDSQKLLLRRQIKIKNNLSSPVLKLLQKKEDSNETQDILNAKDEPNMKYKIFTAYLLNLLIRNSEIESSLKKIEISEFELLYQERKFLKKNNQNDFEEIDGKLEISLEKLLTLTLADKYVVLYGSAGVGKSWAMKGLESEICVKYPEKWVIYVDLKQFIKIFRSEDTKRKNQEINYENLDFAAFMAEHIINAEWDFEKGIFMKMYSIGKVVILFDGFDEIVPDCAGFVSHLAESFNHNGGNQLWISTRDNYEVDLRKILKLEVSYTLDSLSDSEGIDLIAKTWALNELKNVLKTEIKSKDDFQQKFNELNEKNDYESKATELVEKVTEFKNRYFGNIDSIGQIQLYKIFADIGEESLDSIENLSEYTIYDKCFDQHYKIWGAEKGEIREKANIITVKHGSTFYKFHIHQALKLLFPEFSHLCEVKRSKKIWTDDEVIGCGLMEMRNGKFSFTHRTFAEFLVASFVVSTLEQMIIDGDEEMHEDSFKLIAKIIQDRESTIIHTFIDKGLANDNRIENIEEAMEKGVSSSMKNIDDILKHLYAIEIINDKCFDLKQFRNIKRLVRKAFTRGKVKWTEKSFLENIRLFWTKALDQVIYPLAFTESNYAKFKEYVSKELSNKIPGHLDEIIRILINIFEFFEDNELFEMIIIRIRKVHGLGVTKIFLKQQIKLEGKLKKYEGNKRFPSSSVELEEGPFVNIVQIISMKCTYEEFCKFVSFLRKFLSNDEIMELILDRMGFKHESKTKLKNYILMLRDGEISIEEFKTVWKNYENFFNSLNSPEKFKRFLGWKTNEVKTILHTFAKKYKQFDFYQVIFELLLETFKENRDELWKFMNQVDADKRTFIHYLVEDNKSYKEIKCVFENIKDNFGTEKLLDILLKRDCDGNNVSRELALRDSSEMLDYLLNELGQQGMKKLLSNLDNDSNCLLQEIRLSYLRIFLNFNQTPWLIFRKVFDPSEILNFIKNCNRSRENVLHNFVKYQSNKFIMLTWNEVQEIMNENKEFAEKYSKEISGIDQYIKEYLENREYDEKKLDLSWIEDNNLWIFKLPAKQFQEHLNQGKIFNIPTDFNNLAACPDLEIHKISWNFLQNKFNHEVIKNFVLHVSWNGNNFIHQVISNENLEIIKFTLEACKNFSSTQMREILSSKGSLNRNLLQSVICSGKSSEIFQFIWNIFHEYFTESEIKMFIEFADADVNNLLLDAAYRSEKQVFELIWNKAVANHESISEILEMSNSNCENILFLCIKSEDNEKLKFLWAKLENFFRSKNSMNEFRDFLMQGEVKYYIDHYWITYTRSIILQQAARYCDKIDFHETLWELLLKAFENHHEELWNYINRNDKERRTFINDLVKFNDPKIIKFTFDTIKNIHGTKKLLEMFKGFGLFYGSVFYDAVSEASSEKIEFFIDELQELTSSDDFERILSLSFNAMLESAAKYNKNLKSHEMLWKYFQSYLEHENMLNFIKNRNRNYYNFLDLVFKYNTTEVAKFTINKVRNVFGSETLLSMLEEDKQDCDNIFHLTIKTKNSSEKFNILINELQQVTSVENTKVILRKLDADNRNLLQTAAIHNECLSDHINLWKCLVEKFNPSEILDFIRQTSKEEGNLLHCVVKYNEIKIIEFTWNQFKSFMSESEQVDYLKTKEYHGIGLHHSNFYDGFRTMGWVKKIMSEYGIKI